jgi:hypothetical protein
MSAQHSQQLATKSGSTAQAVPIEPTTIAAMIARRFMKSLSQVRRDYLKLQQAANRNGVIQDGSGV